MISDKADIPKEQHEEFDAIVEVLHGVRGPFSVLMHSPGLAQKVMEAGAQVRLGSTLSQVEREIAVIAVSREKDARYEWAAHVRAGRTAGMREEVIEGGDVDMVVATYTINDERAERITFAGPYYEAGQQIMVLEENDTITGPDSLADNPDARICSVTGSTPAEQIREYLASPDQLVLFDEYSQCADSLSNGQVDAVTTDNVILLGFVSESDGEFKLVGEQFTEEPYGIGIEKGDVAFCEFINETLQENEDAYIEAWESTAGQIEGTQTPELPEPAECI